MGMQGFYGSVVRRCRAAGLGHRAPFQAAAVLFFVLHALTGCSSNSSWSSGSNQPVAVAPPPTMAATPQSTGQAPAVPGYPQESLAEAFKRDSATAPAQPSQPSAAGTPVTTSSPATDYLPYPKQTLFSQFQDSGTAQTPNMPHPPSTYTPSAQPYVPPQGQPTYSAASSQSAPRPPSTYTPSGQPYSPPSQPAAATPQSASPPTTADNGQQVSGYPGQSILDIFR